MDDLYAFIDQCVGWLDNHTQSRDLLDLTMRILKVTEEAGEVADHWIRLNLKNPRKESQAATVEQVTDELADVVCTALIAIRSLQVHPADALQRHMNKAYGRINLPTFTASFYDKPAKREQSA